MCDCVKMFMMRYQPFTNLLSTLIEPSLARFHGDAVCTAWRGRGCVCRCVCACACMWKRRRESVTGKWNAVEQIHCVF